MTVNWASAFSGTVTVSVRTTGCGSPSDYYNVIIDVIPETIQVLPQVELLHQRLSINNFVTELSLDQFLPVRFMNLQEILNF